MFARLRCGGNLPMLRPGVDRPLRGNCHPLSCAPDNQVRCVFGSAPYQKPPSMVRNMHAVLKKASWGTRRIFISIRCKKQAFLVQKGNSVPETAFWCTERIKGALNSLLLHRTRFQRPAEQPTPQTVDSLLPHRTHFQRRAVPKAAPAAAAAASVRETAPALFVRSGPFPCSFDGTRYLRRHSVPETPTARR